MKKAQLKKSMQSRSAGAFASGPTKVDRLSGSERGLPIGRRADSGTPKMTRRELNKLDKLNRIKKAALNLFTTLGYDDTTTREVASQADVALATVFVYAKTKRDLLFLTINDELEDAIARAGTELCVDNRFSENVLAVFRTMCGFFIRRAAISRLVLREMVFYEEGSEAIRFQRSRRQFIELILGAIKLAAAKKEIVLPDDPEIVANMIFAIWGIEIRKSLAKEKTNPGETVERLRQQLMLLVTGLQKNVTR